MLGKCFRLSSREGGAQDLGCAVKSYMGRAAHVDIELLEIHPHHWDPPDRYP